MKTVALNFKGEKYSLIYNVAAMFELSERLGDDWIGRISTRDPEGFTALAQTAEIMSEYGANTRADMGFPRPKALAAAAISGRATVREYMDIYESVFMAANLGMQRELEDEDAEIDLVLQELQKKRTGQNKGSRAFKHRPLLRFE